MRQMKEILYTISLKRETYPIESIYTDVVILLLVPDLMVINIEWGSLKIIPKDPKSSFIPIKTRYQKSFNYI